MQATMLTSTNTKFKDLQSTIFAKVPCLGKKTIVVYFSSTMTVERLKEKLLTGELKRMATKRMAKIAVVTNGRSIDKDKQ